MCIHVLGQKNNLSCKTNKQKMVVKVLCTEEKTSFVYLRIRVLGQRNHSLSTNLCVLICIIRIHRREFICKFIFYTILYV